MKSILLYIFLLGSVFSALATHLRAANITATQLSGKKYRIQLLVYTDDNSVVDGGGGVDASEAKIKIGSFFKNELINEEEFTLSRSGGAIDIGNGTFKNVYEKDYEFPNASGGYLISYRGVNRNNGIVNIQDPSDQQALFVETFISLSSSIVNKTTPQLLIDPIDVGAVNQPYTYNSGAFDSDGDSLAFKLVTAKNSRGVDVTSYRFPDHPAFGSSKLSINPVSGTITWDSPREPGIYNIAFLVEEWRNNRRLSYVVRDMQIIIEDSDNEAPVILLPKDTCVAANVLFQDTIITYDPNDNTIDLDIAGSLKGGVNGATFVAIGNRKNDSINLLFTWRPNCSRIRKEPYVAVFTSTDNHPMPLTTISDFTIKVGGKAPNLKSTDVVNDSVILKWDKYSCTSNASKLNVWRRDCDGSSVERDACTFGVPDEWGFELVASVSPLDTSYTDNNNSLGLNNGLKYCYLLDVEFNNQDESYASNISCANLPLSTALVTAASVLVTDENKGQVKVEWIAPLMLDPGFTAPYTYKLYRDNQLINEVIETTLRGGSYIDTLLNTKDKDYLYTIEMFSGSKKIGVSSPASTVFLASDVSPKTLDLKWSTSNGWQHVDTLYDYVYQLNGSDTLLLDSIPSNKFNYKVTGLTDGEEYCFLVKKSYTACNDSVKEVFTSWSNLHCNIPIDTIPPCVPSLSIVDPFCGLFETKSSYTNVLRWETNCEQETQSYNLYYSSTLDGGMSLIAQVDVPDLSFNHINLRSIKGCYRIKAVDEFGNESAFSNKVCQDNCEYYELPNVLTPNGDGKNDTFRPYPEPRFVDKIEFKVFNRWGERVFFTDDINLNWDGNNNEGTELVDGVYYYEAQVTFDKLLEEDQEKEIKGWLKLVR